MKTTFDSFSATGKVRSNNEDHVFCDGKRGVFAVADGMGGGEQGEKASEIVCLALGSVKESAEFAERMDSAESLIELANREILDYARRRGFRQMGTTIALLLFEGGASKRAAVCHVGDSRVYRVRNGEVTQLTKDHSVGAELAATIGGREGRAYARRSNSLSHVLTRAIGTEVAVRSEWRMLDVEPGDEYLICSDGVHDVIENEEIPSLISGVEPGDALKRLSDTVLERGAPDNYSMIIVRCDSI